MLGIVREERARYWLDAEHENNEDVWLAMLMTASPARGRLPPLAFAQNFAVETMPPVAGRPPRGFHNAATHLSVEDLAILAEMCPVVKEHASWVGGKGALPLSCKGDSM